MNVVNYRGDVTSNMATPKLHALKRAIYRHQPYRATSIGETDDTSSNNVMQKLKLVF